MDARRFAWLKGEIVSHISLYFGMFAVLMTAFYRENPLAVFRFSSSLYWLFVLPGATLLAAWRKQYPFLERAAMGCAIAFVLIGVPSYYLAIAGLNLRWHGIIFPTALIAAGLIGGHRYPKEGGL